MKLEDFLAKSVTTDYIDLSPKLDVVESGMSKLLKRHLKEMLIPDYLLNDPEAVGYPDEQMQKDIYMWTLQYMVGRHTVKDIGCGRGDFGDYFPAEYYTGIDINQIMISAGKQKHPDLNLICDDYLNYTETTDYTVCIGTLNTFIGIEKWEWFDRTLAYALDTSNIASIFVLQSDTELDGYLSYPINEILTRIPSKLPFKLDYTKFEDIYVLVVYKQPYS